MRNYDENEENFFSKNKKSIIAGVVALVFVLLAFDGCYSVKPGQAGILSIANHVQSKPLSSGWGYTWPIFGKVNKMNVQTQVYEDSLDAYTNDKQNVIVRYTINFEPRFSSTPVLFERVGVDYQKNLLPGRFFEVTKSVIGKMKAQELVTDRDILGDKVQAAFRKKLREECDYFDNVLVQIADLQFSPEYDKTNENKEIERELALTAENKTRRIEEEAKQKRITAQAEADAIRIMAEALAKNQDIVAIKWIEKWDGHTPATYAGGEKGSVSFYVPAPVNK